MDAPPPDGLARERHLAYSRGQRFVFRYTVQGCLVTLLALGLLNVFGARPAVNRAESDVARLEVKAPTTVRGGLFFEGRFRIDAREALEHATLVLDPGWQKELSINTIEPAPIGESSRDGRLELDFGAVRPGGSIVAYLQFQVNPSQFRTRRAQGVSLADGDRELLRIDRSLTVFP